MPAFFAPAPLLLCGRSIRDTIRKIRSNKEKPMSQGEKTYLSKMTSCGG